MFRTDPLHKKAELNQAAPHWSQIGVRASEPARPFWTDERYGRQNLDHPHEVESIVARGHAKVLAHYRLLLRSPGLAPEERADIETRIARGENYWLEATLECSRDMQVVQSGEPGFACGDQ